MTSFSLAIKSARRFRRLDLLLLCISLGLSGFAFAGEKATTHNIVIESMEFTPATVDVKVGDTVVWVNKDPFPHTATSPRRFSSGSIDSGRSWRFRVTKKGTFVWLYLPPPHESNSGSEVNKQRSHNLRKLARWQSTSAGTSCSVHAIVTHELASTFGPCATCHSPLGPADHLPH